MIYAIIVHSDSSEDYIRILSAANIIDAINKVVDQSNGSYQYKDVKSVIKLSKQENENEFQ